MKKFVSLCLSLLLIFSVLGSTACTYASDLPRTVYGSKVDYTKSYRFHRDNDYYWRLYTNNGKQYIYQERRDEFIKGKYITLPESKSSSTVCYVITSKTTGEICRGLVTLNGVRYISNKSNGNIVRGGFVRCDSKRYLVDYQGKVLYGLQQNRYSYGDSGNWVICSKSDGHIFYSQFVTCDGKKYYCNKSGDPARILPSGYVCRSLTFGYGEYYLPIAEKDR